MEANCPGRPPPSERAPVPGLAANAWAKLAVNICRSAPADSAGAAAKNCPLVSSSHTLVTVKKEK